MCFIDVDIDTSASFASERVVKARKAHKCCECGAPIAIGNKYEYVSGLWEGAFSQYKTCLACKEIRDRFFCTWYYGMIWDTFLSDYAMDVDLGSVDGMSVEAIEKLESMCARQWYEDDEDDD